MAALGIGHNLEKNLRKVEGLRARGQLDKALHQLQEWARRYPETPHYLYEAAMAAFDLGDYSSGLTSLKSLLRSTPDTRERVFKACTERFRDNPALPLGEFLVENYAGARRFSEAFGVVERLAPEQLELYRKRTSMRHHSLVATPNSRAEALRLSHSIQLVTAHGTQDGDLLVESTLALLDLEPTRAEELAEVCRAELTRLPEKGAAEYALAHCLCRSGELKEGGTLLVRGVRGRSEWLPQARALANTIEPAEHQRASWLRILGDLSLLEDDGEAAAENYREAADADPKLRDGLLAHLEAAPEPESPDGRAALLKLRLRLAVVLCRYDDVPRLAERLRQEELASPEELRALMGEGNENPSGETRPTELLVLLAENALRGGDLRGVAMHVSEIPDQEEHVLHKLLRTVDELADDWDPSSLLELLALQAVLRARVGDAERANETLARLWRDWPEEHDTLTAVTSTCLQKVGPSPGLLVALLPASAEANDPDTPREVLEGLLRDIEGPPPELPDRLVEHLREQPEQGSFVLALLDGCDRSLGGAQHLRFPLAVAALLAGEAERALPEFSVLLMTQPQRIESVRELLEEALGRNPEDVELNLATADLLVEAGEPERAAAHLAQALEISPSRAEELSERFESLFRAAPDCVAIRLRYARALYTAGRFDQLQDVCRRAAQELGEVDAGDFHLLQARMFIEESRLGEAMTILDRLLRSESVDPGEVAEVLRRAVDAHPTSSEAQLLLGVACSAANQLEEGIEAFLRATRQDPSLMASVTSSLQTLAARPAAQGEHLFEIARFHRRHGDMEQAATHLDRALRLDESLAPRILGELGPALEEPRAEVPLLLVGARAARICGNVERACDLLLRADQLDARRFEHILGEFRRMSEQHPTQLLPILCVGRVLLTHRAPEAAAQIVADAGLKDSYPHEGRLEMLREFHGRLPHDSRLGLALVGRLSEAGRVDEAVALLRSSQENHDFEASAGAALCRELRERAPEHGELGLLEHDLLLRSGLIEEALRALPDPDALDPSRLGELTERLSSQTQHTLADPALALRQADALHRQGRHDEAVETLRGALDVVDTDQQAPLRVELARLLHESGQAEESRSQLRHLGEDDTQRREAYQLFASWTEERLRRQSQALRERLERSEDNGDLALQLAEKLMDQDRFEEIPPLLRDHAGDEEFRLRRACTLARAYLEMQRADLAEATLRAVPTPAEGGEWAERQRWLLAQCADRLGRPAESHVRYADLVGSGRFGDGASRRARESYGHYLSEAAREYRAVLTGISSLEDRESMAEERR